MLLLPNEAEINKQELSELSKNGLVLDFSANWCGPCKKIYPLLKFIATKYDNIKIVKIDIDKDDDEIAETYQIQSLPTIVIVKNEKEMKRESGVKEGGINIIRVIAELLVKDEINDLAKNVNTELGEEFKKNYIKEHTIKILNEKIKEIHSSYQEYLENTQLS